VAGLVDGEGCFTLIERTNKECVHRSFAMRLSVEMADKARPLLDMLHQRLGGTLHRRKARTERNSGCTIWNVHTRAALPILEAMHPHLIVKQEQCRLAIAACRMMIDKPIGFEATVGVLKELISELNQRGPANELPNGWFARVVDGTWITPQGDLCEKAGLGLFKGPWPQAGILRNGAAYPLPQSEHPTIESESGLWHTPVARDFKGYTKRDGESICNQLRKIYGGSGRPNPTWLAWLMGYPEGWLDLP